MVKSTESPEATYLIITVSIFYSASFLVFIQQQIGVFFLDQFSFFLFVSKMLRMGSFTKILSGSLFSMYLNYDIIIYIEIRVKYTSLTIYEI
jgi:hypothetical protein